MGKLRKQGVVKLVINFLLIIMFIAFIIIDTVSIPIIAIGVLFMILEIGFENEKLIDAFSKLKYFFFCFGFLIYCVLMLLKGISYFFSFISLLHLIMAIVVLGFLIVEKVYLNKKNRI